jgi:hypothetical protein
MLAKHVPCVDGSELARDIFTFAELVGAGMCSACLRGGEAAGHNALHLAQATVTRRALRHAAIRPYSITSSALTTSAFALAQTH